MMNARTQTRSLSDGELLKYAPSIFAKEPKHTVSDKYAFIPTTRVMDALRREGWSPVSAMQSVAKHPEGYGYQKHIIRFRRESEATRMLKQVGDCFPEIVLTNSHDGTSSFVINSGIFRLVCSNGLIVADQTFASERIRHVGYKDEDVIEASYRVLNDFPKIANKVSEFQQIQLTDEERRAYARSAGLLKWDEGNVEQYVDQILYPRRYGDKEKNLWVTFNVVQENLLRGGMRGRSASRRRTTTREVKSVNENLRLNKALWSLTEQMRELKIA